MTDVLNRWVIEPVNEIPEPARGGGLGRMKPDVAKAIDTLKANPNRAFRIFVADNHSTINSRYGTMKSVASRLGLDIELGTRKEGENLYSLYAQLNEGERL